VAGGGTGDHTIFLAEQLREYDASVTCIDISRASLEIARKRGRIRKTLDDGDMVPFFFDFEPGDLVQQFRRAADIAIYEPLNALDTLLLREPSIPPFTSYASDLGA